MAWICLSSSNLNCNIYIGFPQPVSHFDQNQKKTKIQKETPSRFISISTNRTVSFSENVFISSRKLDIKKNIYQICNNLNIGSSKIGFSLFCVVFSWGEGGNWMKVLFFRYMRMSWKMRTGFIIVKAEWILHYYSSAAKYHPRKTKDHLVLQEISPKLSNLNFLRMTQKLGPIRRQYYYSLEGVLWTHFKHSQLGLILGHKCKCITF